MLSVLPFTIAFAATVLCNIPNVLAWGAAGHEIVATIAQIYLHPSVFPQLCDILNYTSPNPHTSPPCHLAPVAAWADKVRYSMRWSAPLHYVGALGDHPPDTCLFPGERGWAGRNGANVLGAVRNTTAILRDWSGAAGNRRENRIGHATTSDFDAGMERANEALKFLIHFLGDLHMPLHLTGRDRGGNSVKVRFENRLTNLHSLWDNLLIAKALRTIPRNYTRPLPIPRVEFALRGTIYDPYVRRIVHQGLLRMWLDEVPTWLSCPSPNQPSRFRAPDGSYPRQHVMSLREIPTSGLMDDDEVSCPYHWAKPIHALNCDFVWPSVLDKPPYNQHRFFFFPEEDNFDGYGPEESESQTGNPVPYLELDTPEYAGLIFDGWVVEKLLAMAGVRLAGILNHLFADNINENTLMG